MRRFNYLADPRELTAARFPTAIAIDNRILAPLATLLATLVLTVALGAVQVARLHAAQKVTADVSARLIGDSAAAAAVAKQRARIAAKMRMLERIADIRHRSVRRANELAWIGNHLPAQTWLNVLRFEHGSYSLDGGATHVAAIGLTLLALRDPLQPLVPKLVSLRNDRTDGAAAVHYTLTLAEQP